MPEQARAHRTERTNQGTERQEEGVFPEKVGETAVKGTADTTDEADKITDDVLAEIDSVLEVNAAEFVRSYVQRGGE